MQIKTLVGSGDKIGRLTLPFMIIGVVLNMLYPSLFSVGGPSPTLRTLSLIILIPGIINWAWSAYLILSKIPKKELITSGPYSIVKHPLYTGVAFLVLPWVGFLLNSWLGVLIGAIIYVGSRLYSQEEEKILSKAFGSKWDKYKENVYIKWL